MSQKIMTGIEHFDELCAALSPKSILLVCDSSFRYLPDSIQSIYSNHKETVTVFNAFTPNPQYEQVCEGVKLFNDEQCDAIVAIGGGSTIDVAKCIKLFCKMNPSVNYLQQEYKDSGVPLIAIPTTAGTGSESTQHAVIYYNGAKQSISHPSIVPNYCILEPSVLKTLPIYQKKCTMLDALCQGIESWWSVNSTDESKQYSKTAVDTIVVNYKAYIFDNDDEAAKQIMLAANYAGRAINISQTTAAHAMSYKITSLYKLPHGHAVAVGLPVVWEYMIHNITACADMRGKDYLQKVFEEIPINVEWFKALLKELGINNPTASEREKEIDILTQSVNPVRLKNNPVALSNGVLRNMYERIIK
ncbi:MAG TPA: phosphonoacetaldehyde reductase [Oscillospiraceae bacterium]|nr:phosphonoacetaldehyde reductase [Oscillospiraceae bacterium]HPS35121.1 phosphonoacetaldehyde reductase [Oscillospiraceae bacterium]